MKFLAITLIVRTPPAPTHGARRTGSWSRTVSTRSSPAPRVAGRLEQLQEATGADELLITTIAHGHQDRVRSYELLAEEWRRRGHTRRPG